MWRPGQKKRSATEDDVVAEATRLVGGQAVDGYVRGQRIPGWVIVNVLAHAERDQLRAIASDEHAGHPADWDASLAYLAVEILAAAPGPEPLRRLQRAVLVPLELGLLDDSIAMPRAGGELATLVMEALGVHRFDRGY